MQSAGIFLDVHTIGIDPLDFNFDLGTDRAGLHGLVRSRLESAVSYDSLYPREQP
jgi:hypothetical protein